jgi:hypothetical protein
MPDRDTAEENLTGDEALLAEIRDRFDYCQDQWKDVRDEAKTDMLYVSGDPWSQADRLRREQAGRPCLVMDEYSQYANQIINDIRQNERAVEVVPRGFGANDKTARLRGDLIREIEYKSNAQAAYCAAFENMLNRSYGGWKIVRRYVSDKSFDQEIRIVPIPNPDSSYPDPDCKEADYSDAKFWFLLDLVPRKEYKRRYPKAQITDFAGVHFSDAPAWIKEDQIQVAEYWRVEFKKRLLLQVRVADDQPVISLFEDELPEGESYQSLKDAKKLLDEREVQERSIVQYITNGVEILEKNPQPGKYIPIVWLTGKELYVNDGSGPKRILMSLVRLARDPLMMVNYLATCEAEVIGMTPKTPWVGVVGQFHKPDNWQKAVSEPVAYLEYKAITEATGGQVLPAPQRPAYEPQIAALEAARESSRRAVQAALGLSALPTNAQRLNDKSGVALKQIDANEDRGSFHYIDKYEMGLEHNGRIINDLIPHVYHQEGREIGVRDRKGQHRSTKINAPSTDADGQPVNLDLTAGEHEVTISTGPSYESERDLANHFVDTMIPELEGMQLDPAVKAKLLALLIKLKNVGPIGDEMAELLDPQNPQGQATQQLAQAQGQLQQYQAMIAELQTEVQNLTLEKKAKVIETKGRLVQSLIDRETQLTVAEINTKAQSIEERVKFVEDMWAQFHQQAHEAGMQASDQAHAKEQADATAQLAAAQAQNSPQPGNNGAGAGA